MEVENDFLGVLILFGFLVFATWALVHGGDTRH